MTKPSSQLRSSRMAPALAARAALAGFLALAAAGCDRGGEETPAAQAPPPKAPAAQQRAVPAGAVAFQPDRLYFFTVRGEAPVQTAVLVSGLERPLAVRSVTSDNPLFSGRVRELEPGRRFEVAVTLSPEAPAGRHEGRLLLATDDPAHAAVPLEVRAAIQEVVSARPDRVYFGSIYREDLDREDAATRKVLVESHRGNLGQPFRVLGAETGLPFVETEVEAQKEGTSYLVTLRLVQAKAPKGEIAGTLVVRTDDRDFPRLELPITGTIL